MKPSGEKTWYGMHLFQLENKKKWKKCTKELDVLHSVQCREITVKYKRIECASVQTKEAKWCNVQKKTMI